MPLCGHATLAAAAALWMGEGCAADTLYFETVRNHRPPYLSYWKRIFTVSHRIFTVLTVLLAYFDRIFSLF